MMGQLPSRVVTATPHLDQSESGLGNILKGLANEGRA
jgi:hypothetical protein